MPITTTNATQEELESRRSAILAGLGLSLEELIERRAAGHLTADEWEAWEELDGIGYLLADA